MSLCHAINLCFQDRRELEHPLRYHSHLTIPISTATNIFPSIHQNQLLLTPLLRRAHPVRTQRDAHRPGQSRRHTLLLHNINHPRRRLGQVARHERHGISSKKTNKVSKQRLVSGDGRTSGAEASVGRVARLAKMRREAAAFKGDALDAQGADFFVQGLDEGAQRGFGGGVVRHEGEGHPGGAGGGEADAAVALGTEEGHDGLGDAHVPEEVGLEHVVDECLTRLKLEIPVLRVC